jgi:dTDP-4-amino-4,6-dideoxygalactose transaminase
MSDLAIRGGDPIRRRPFAQWPRHTEADARRLMAVLESGNWGGFPYPNALADEFARRFAEYHGARYGACITNGTIALVAALRAAGVRFGDEVIVPAYTWDGTAGAVLMADAVPVFADVDPDTYCLDVASVRAVITPRTKAVIPVHLAMRFADTDPLLDLAVERDLIVIEDCAHAHGGQYKGRGAGSMGDAGCFSFQSSKIMTSGEGGAVITNRLDLFEMVQTLSNCGRASVTDRFKKRIVGANYRVTEFQAALLLGQLEQLDVLREKRSRRAAMLTEGLAAIDGVRPLPAQPALTRETIYNYVFQYRGRAARDRFVAALDAEGIPCDGRFYEAVYRSDLFPANADDFEQLKGVDYSAVKCPVSERAAYEEAVWLPQFLLIGEDEDVADILRAVDKVMRNLDDVEGVDAGVKSMGRAERPRLERKNY